MTLTSAFANMTNPSMTDYAFAFKDSLGELFIFLPLIAILIVIMSAIYFVSKDLILGAVFGSFITTILAFIFVLVQNDSGERLLGFDRFVVFLIILAITSLYKWGTDI